MHGILSLFPPIFRNSQNFKVFIIVNSLLFHQARIFLPSVVCRKDIVNTSSPLQGVGKAKKLHIKDPLVYKDGNHKPEMALVVTKFESLCGIVIIEELQRILKGVPEKTQLVGAAVVDQLLNITPEDGEDTVKTALKQLFTQIMSASEHVIAEVLSQLIPCPRKKDEFC